MLGKRGLVSASALAVVVALQVPAMADTPPSKLAGSTTVAIVVPGNSESRIEHGGDQPTFTAAVATNFTTPTPAPSAPRTVAAAPGPLPIYDTSGALVAYTSAADLSGRKDFVPVLDATGSIVGYHLVLQSSGSVNPSRLVPDPGKRTCQNAADSAAAYAGGSSNPAPLTNSTKWSRNFRYVAQGVDALVTATAIRHGAVSRGLFGFIRSPIGFIAGEAIQDLILDRTTASACPSVQNLTNLGLGLSAVVNAFRASAP